eukprot:11032273-Karenia_brevis.AAC.1
MAALKLIILIAARCTSLRTAMAALKVITSRPAFMAARKPITLRPACCALLLTNFAALKVILGDDRMSHMPA